MFYRLAIAGTLAATICSPVFAERPPLPLDPSTPWTLNYGAEKCSLMRRFGSGQTQATLQIDSYGEWNRFRVLLYGSALPKLSGVTGTAYLRLTGDPLESDFGTLEGTADALPAISFDLSFLPYGDPRDRRHMTAKERSKYGKDHGFDVIQAQPDYDATIDSLSVRVGSHEPIQLQLGNMAKPLAAMRACVDTLVKSWGADPEVQRTLSRQAKPVKSTVKKVQADYPQSMLNNGINAYVPVRLRVDADGHPSQCVVQRREVPTPFSQAVCDHLAGSFEPALDKDGHPVASEASLAVFYNIEE